MLPTFNVTGSGLASIQSCFSRKQSHRCVLFFVQELLVAETAAINAHSFCYSVVRIIHHSFEKLIWERWLLQIFKQYVAQMALSRGRGSCWLLSFMFSCPVRLLFFFLSLVRTFCTWSTCSNYFLSYRWEHAYACLFSWGSHVSLVYLKFTLFTTKMSLHIIHPKNQCFSLDLTKIALNWPVRLPVRSFNGV